jgi:hypothetical protein
MPANKKSRGRPGITLEDVRRACTELQEEGRAVGPRNVRLQLGGRGGYGTIMRYLRELGFSQRKPPTL